MEVDEIENKAGILRKEAESFNEKLSKRGVIYLSRVPPFMKPNKVKSYFEQYGEVTRLFLAEEDSSRRLKRKNNGGNASKQFHEGYCEVAFNITNSKFTP
jgi:ESF2/ABP1 family protein